MGPVFSKRFVVRYNKKDRPHMEAQFLGMPDVSAGLFFRSGLFGLVRHRTSYDLRTLLVWQARGRIVQEKKLA